MIAHLFLSAKHLILILLCFFTINVCGQSIELVTDIDQTPENIGSEPTKMTEIGGKLIFSAETSNHGRELFEMDINENITLVADLYPGIESSHPTNILEGNQLFNGELVFTCNNGVNGFELWKYDGVNPPQLIVDLFPTSSSYPQRGYVFNGNLYFTAFTPAYGTELWAYDGVNPPTMVMDIFPGALSSAPNYFIQFNNKLFFSANDGTHGNELWEYDGITSPTMVADIDTSVSLSSNPKELIVYNSILYFSANDSIHGTELWQYNGVNSPSMIEDLYPGTVSSEPENLTIFNGHIVFGAKYPQIGEEIWRYDGNNIQLIADLAPGPANSIFGTHQILNNELFFAASNNTHGRELWKLTSATSSPIFVMDICQGTCSSNPNYFTAFNNSLFFVARSSYVDFEIWNVNNTSIPFQVTDVNPGSNAGVLASPFIFNNRIYFAGDNGMIGKELWKLNGLTSQLVENINKGNETSAPTNFTVLDSALYFFATTDSNGRELWKNDLNGGTNLELEIIPGAADAFPWGLTNFDSKLYFVATDTLLGAELWSYDPSTSALNIVTNINPFGGSIVGVPFEYNGKLVFRGADGTSPNSGEFFEYDPLTSTAQLIANINPGGASNPSGFCQFQGKLYFSARTNLHGFELWEYDGVNPPTEVADLLNGSASSDPKRLVVFNGKMYYSGAIGSAGRELLVYDGSNPPTLAADINPSGSSSPNNLTVFNGKLYFNADDGVHGLELWEYDGSNPPALIADINPGAADAILTSGGALEVSNNLLFFDAIDGVHGNELWVFDGANSPSMVQDFIPGPDGQGPYSLTDVYDNLYFSGVDNIVGRELWRLCWNPTFDTLNITSDCSYTAANNIVYYQSGTYDIVIENSLGCDSLIHINLSIIDTIAPTVLGLDTTYYDCSSPQAYIIPNFTNISDNCSSDLQINLLSISSNNGTNPEIITREYQILDESGNSTLVNHVLVVNDTISPTVALIDTSFVDCNSNVPPVDIGIIQSPNDNCTIDSLYFVSELSNGQTCPEIITRTYAVSDLSGNITYTEHVIVIADTVAPVPVSLIALDTAWCSIDSLSTPFSIDNCADTIWAQTSTQFPLFSSGLYDITWSYQDACGNTSEQVQQIYFDHIETTISQSTDTMYSDALEADTYQWINCTDSSPIIGMNYPYFVPTDNGIYAVILTYDNCVDTSDCISSTVGQEELLGINQIAVFPNPTEGIVYLTLDKKYEIISLRITDNVGRILSENQYIQNSMIQAEITDPPGVYFMTITYGENRVVFKVIKEK